MHPIIIRAAVNLTDCLSPQIRTLGTWTGTGITAASDFGVNMCLCVWERMLLLVSVASVDKRTRLPLVSEKLFLLTGREAIIASEFLSQRGKNHCVSVLYFY